MPTGYGFDGYGTDYGSYDMHKPKQAGYGVTGYGTNYGS